MNMNKVNLIIATLLVLLVVAVLGGIALNTPSAERTYKQETKQMRKIREHQMLTLEIIQINAALNKLATPPVRALEPQQALPPIKALPPSN